MKSTILPELSRPVIVAIGAAALVLLPGCQSTVTGNSTAPPAGASSATQPATANAPLVAKPRPVVVRDFAFDTSQLHTDPGPMPGRDGPARRVIGELRPQEAPAQKAARLAELLSETIAKELAGLRIPASRELAGSPLPANGLLVSGQFMQVDEGNRLKRAVVGFGAGASEVLAQVAVYDLVQSRDQPILVYGTGTGSKPAPGAVVSLNPYTMAAKYVLSRNATEKDVRNLGKQIAKDLAQLEAGGSLKQ